ncbi:UNVERIFIED_CONTAM: hypothetical protein HDU68_005344 [Siphonaria sp. JEL0065]|nr:hypothetical protein HDU68_005344 [Siphonaria sp. JEL0065]
MSDQFEEMLDGMNQRSAASPLTMSLEPGAHNLLSILNDPRTMIQLPPPHMPHPVCIETAPPSSDYEEIKAFLRWNSEPDIEGVSMDANTSPITNDSSHPAVPTTSTTATTINNADPSYAVSIYTSSGSSNNLMPSPPITTTTTSPGNVSGIGGGSNNSDPAFTNQMQFTYDPHSLALQPEAYFGGFTGYEEPRYSSNALHGFELMTDHAYYGYSDPCTSFANAYYPLSIQDPQLQQQQLHQQQQLQLPLSQQQFSSSSSVASSSSQQHSQQTSFLHHLQQQQQQQQQNPQQQQQQQQQQQSNISASKAFRWAAAAASANTPTSHISLSMIVPQQKPDDPITQLFQHQIDAHPQKQKKTSSLTTTVNSSSTTRGTSGANSTGNTTTTNNSFSPYKKPSSKSLNNNNTHQTNTKKSSSMKNSSNNNGFSTNTPTLRDLNSGGGGANGPVKVVGIEHLESQQKWFKAQIAEQAKRQSRLDVERGGMLAALMKIAGNSGGGVRKERGEF